MRSFKMLTFSISVLIAAADPSNVPFAKAAYRIGDAHLNARRSTDRAAHDVRRLASGQDKKRKESRRPTPQQIWMGIKSAAQNEVRSNSPLIVPATFAVRQVGSTRQLTIVKGDVAGLGFRDDPYELPFKKQILIESLRRSLASSDLTGAKKTGAKEGTSGRAQRRSDADSYWQPYLLQAEDLVKKSVVDIEASSDDNSLKEKLRETESQIDEILYDKIYRAVEQNAQRDGYNTIYERGGGETGRFSVNISTVPDGAKVWVMTGLVYKKQLIKKIDRSQWPWIEVVQNPADLLGGYHYRAEWPDGRRTEGDIEVKSASPVRILPN